MLAHVKTCKAYRFNELEILLSSAQLQGALALTLTMVCVACTCQEAQCLETCTAESLQQTLRCKRCLLAKSCVHVKHRVGKKPKAIVKDCHGIQREAFLTMVVCT